MASIRTPAHVYDSGLAPMSNEWYHGHKVVAMPPDLLGDEKNVRLDSSRSETKERFRSSSIVREPHSEVVHELYDRIGSNYNRGRASDQFSAGNSSSAKETLECTSSPSRPPRGADKFQQRYRAAAAVSRGRSSEPRSRVSAPPTPDKQKKHGRPPPRGSSISSRWPPVGPNSSNQAQSKKANAEGSSRDMKKASNGDGSVLRSLSFDNRSQHSKKDKGRKYSLDVKEEKKESDADLIADQQKKQSVKDRVSSFGSEKKHGNRRSSGAFPPGYSSTYTIVAPPKVNIYEELRRDHFHSSDANKASQYGKSMEETRDENQRPTRYPEPSRLPPSTVAVAAADVAAKIVKSGWSGRSQRPSDTSNSYLVALPPKSHSSQGSISDISHQEGLVIGDSRSMEASSGSPVGDNEFSFERPRKDIWRELSSQPNQKSENKTISAGVKSMDNSISMDIIDQRIDERVRAHLSKMEAKMESVMSRWMHSMDERLTDRLEMLDARMRD